MADLGFHALSFDPPGTWESPGDISLYTTTNYLRATNEIVEHFENKPTFVAGHSRGGSLSMLAAINNPNVISFAAIMSFAYDFKSRKDDEWRKKGYIESFRDLPPGGGDKIKKFVLPYSFFEDQLKYNMLQDLKILNKPKLFILGKQDVLVPPKKVREAYDMSAEPKELYELDSGHDYRLNQEKVEEINQQLGIFLQKHKL